MQTEYPYQTAAELLTPFRWFGGRRGILSLALFFVSLGNLAVFTAEAFPSPIPGMATVLLYTDLTEKQRGYATMIESKGSQPPPVIIALTAYAIRGDQERCLAVGMDDYLAKPIVPKELQTVVSRWFPV